MAQGPWAPVLSCAPRARRPSEPGASTAAKAGWEGRYLGDFETGDVFRSRVGRTVSEADNTWFTLLTNNDNQIHFNAEYAKRTQWGQRLVNSTFTLALVTGLTVTDA